MKFVVSSSELLKGILTVQKAIPNKTSEAILEDYLFVLEGDSLRITASDMEITLRTVIKVESNLEDGMMSVKEGLEKAIALLKRVIVFEHPGDMWWA